MTEKEYHMLHYLLQKTIGELKETLYEPMGHLNYIKVEALGAAYVFNEYIVNEWAKFPEEETEGYTEEQWELVKNEIMKDTLLYDN